MESIESKIIPFKIRILEYLDDDLRILALNQLKILWTHSSNAIEGNTLTLGNTITILEQGINIKGKSIREHNEIIGHARAIDILYSILEKDKLTKDLIFNFHKEVEYGIQGEGPVANWKKEKNGALVSIHGKLKFHTFPFPEDIDHLMSLWLEEFGKFSYNQHLSIHHLIEIYARMHLSFVKIHPFFDGNGRMARLIANFPLLKFGYTPIIIPNEKREEYIDLIEYYDDTTPVLDSDSTKLLEEENKYYIKFLEFCREEYKHSRHIIQDVEKIQNHRVSKKLFECNNIF